MKLDDDNAFRTMDKAEIRSWKTKVLEPPSNFGYFGDNDKLFDTWSLGPLIEHRDSSIREKANAQSMKETLRSDPTLADDWEIISCNHWLVGWSDHLAFRVVNAGGDISRVARVIKGMLDSLSEYPVLDDSKYSETELDATMSNIRNHYKTNGMVDDLPDDWADQMWSWWWNGDQGAVENSDGQGGYPSDQQFEQCARALGFWDTSEDEEE